MFPKYRTTFGEIVTGVEAIQLSSDNVVDVALWCRGVQVVEHDALEPDNTYAGINVPTIHGMRRASAGDYIIKHPTRDLGQVGHFYVNKPRDFESMYEKEV